MSQINRRFASFFVVFAAIIVYQFSLFLAVAILVIAVFFYQGFQMSDLTINVPSSTRAQSLVSSLYSWTESAVSTVVKKCKNLTVSETEPSSRLPIQSSCSPRTITTQQSFCHSSDSVSISNRENIYQGPSYQSSRVSENFPKATASCSSVTTSEWNRKSSNPSSGSLNKSLNSTSRFDYDNDSFSQRSSPWGYSLSPQQRNNAADVRPVTSVASPLSASSRHNANRDSALFVDVNSPGFSSRLLKYHSEAAIHQPQYTRPGQLPLVHLNTSPLPSLTARNSQKVRAPVRVRIAPPTYDASESRLFARPEKQAVPEQQSKSVIEVLKEISRKRMHTEDGGNDAKRHHPQSDSSSSSSSSSSPAMVNGVLAEQAPTGKRPREEDSPKLQKPTVKRTRNNEIYSSLSSSRNINIGIKRKAADSWSRCSTPVPIGKHLKKSPHQAAHLSEENDNAKSVEELSHQKEHSPLPKLAPEGNIQIVERENSPSPTVNIVRQVDPQPSSHHLPESISEEIIPLKNQQARSHHGRLFVKAFSRGIASETEIMKDARRSGGTMPWKTQRTIDADAITGEDIVGQDLELGSRRLKSMFSVLQSNASTAVSSEPPKGDTVDSAPSKVDASKPQLNVTESKGNVSTVKVTEKSLSNPGHNLGEQPFPASTPASSESASSEVPNTVVPTTSISQIAPTSTFGSVPSSLPSSTPPFVANEKNDSVPSSSQAPAAVTPSTTSSNPNSSTTSLPFPSIAPSSDASVITQSSSTTSHVTPSESQSKVITSVTSTVPSGLFGSPSTATFTVPQQAEKPPVTTTSTFTFGASPTAGVASAPVSSSSLGLPASSSTSTPAVSSMSQPTVAPSFAMLSQNPPAAVSANVTISKSGAPVSSTGGFSFAPSSSASPSTSALGGFSVPKTTSSAISFGISNTPTSTFAATSAVTSQPNVPTAVTTNADFHAPKSFGFGATQPAAAQASGTSSSSGGFNFQFGSTSQPNLAAPKPQEAPAGFKFSFGASKEGGLSASQPTTNPIAKPPPFGEGFNFGATSSNTNSEEDKPMSLGTPTGLTHTMAAPANAPPAGGFNFTADANASASMPKSTFEFGANNAGSGTTGSVLGSSGGGFNFGPIPAEPPAVAPAPAAPNLGSPFQFGANSQVMPSSSTLQPQAQTVNSPFSIRTSTEQKSSVLGGGFSFGNSPSASISPLQQSAPSFGQSSVPNFGSSTINPLQNQQAAPTPSLFQFGSGGSAMPQPGMSSGGFNFGGATAPGAPPSGFNFNPTGPSATTPFQFGANPLQPGMQAPAMFSIGSGSTAPRSRPRNRRQT